MSAPTQPLARALDARLREWIRSSDPAPLLAWTPTLIALDAADRAYRTAIEKTLGPTDAARVFEAMSTFRAEVAALRERTRTELEEMYARASRSYGDFDPLDSFVPSPAGLAHVDGVRAADLADRAKADVETLRARANERIAPAIGSNAAPIVAAKRTRNATFAGAIHAVVVPLLETGPIGKAVESLSQLAASWY